MATATMCFSPSFEVVIFLTLQSTFLYFFFSLAIHSRLSAQLETTYTYCFIRRWFVFGPMVAGYRLCLPSSYRNMTATYLFQVHLTFENSCVFWQYRFHFITFIAVTPLECLFVLLRTVCICHIQLTWPLGSYSSMLPQHECLFVFCLDRSTAGKHHEFYFT